MVDREKLKQDIDNALKTSTNVEVYIPTYEVEPTTTKSEIENSVALRGSFSTSYASSSSDRKYNVRHALEAFNGMIVAPNQEVSFNETTGSRTAENGYKKANVILNGVYVEGTGGGVCQSSTTLYNALLLADVEILEVNKHTLPSSYVWLAFDAMVSEGYSDLRFKNSTDENLYIKTYSDDENVYVEVYGKPFMEGEKIVRRVEFLGAIPHPGDRIIPDTNKEYSNKVTYKGEYLRLKYPRENKHSNKTKKQSTYKKPNPPRPNFKKSIKHFSQKGRNHFYPSWISNRRRTVNQLHHHLNHDGRRGQEQRQE